MFTVKRLAISIGRGNSNARHGPARFRRRTKVVSKRQTMIGLSLRLLHHLRDFARHATPPTPNVCNFLQLELSVNIGLLIVREDLEVRFGVVMYQLVWMRQYCITCNTETPSKLDFGHIQLA